VVVTHAGIWVYCLRRYQTINAMTRSERVAEGEAILASLFSEVAIAA